MTAQVTDILRIDTTELAMRGEAFSLWEQVRTRRHTIGWGGYDTSCYRGYRGEWSVRDRRLFFDAYTHPTDAAPPPRLTVPGSPGGVFAHWATGLVVCGEGEVVDYVHAGYASTWEKEHALMFDRGVLTGRIELAPTSPDEAPWWYRVEELLRMFGVPVVEVAPEPPLELPPEPDPAGCAACHARWVDDRRYAENAAYEARDAAASTRWLTQRPGAIVEPIGLEDARRLGMAHAVGPGVPALPFGHLAPGWERLCDEIGPCDSLVHVRIPIGTKPGDDHVRQSELRALCVQGRSRGASWAAPGFDQFVYTGMSEG
ncbi:MAG: hypothetical protein RJA99_4532 [Pseudomonadota bacterium]|jgi:hypothetical protein